MTKEKKESLRKSMESKSLNDLLLLASYLREKSRSRVYLGDDDLPSIISEIDEIILDRTLNGE